MINYKNNNNRRNKFRTNNRNFRSNGSNISNLGLKNNFQRRYSNGNNNATKLIEKYNTPKDRFEFQALYGVPMDSWHKKNLSKNYKYLNLCY